MMDLSTASVYFKVVKGTIFFILMIVTTFCEPILFFPIFTVLYGLKLQCALWLADSLTCTWYAFLVAMLKVLLNVKIVVKGDARKLNQHDSCLIVMNHRTRLDWMYFFAVQAKYASLRRFKIAMKDEMKYIPGSGWGMQAVNFMFLKRSWNKDKTTVNTILNQFKRYKYSPQLLLFPEGTDFREDSKESSDRFAEKNGLPSYDYVLHPRTTGFTYIFDYMRTHNELDQVIDVTVSYPKNIMQKETDIFTGNHPKEVVFTVACFNMDELPVDGEAELAHWLEDRWKKKEEYLKELYENGDYVEDDGQGYSEGKTEELERDSTLYLVGVVIFWAFLMVFVIWMLSFHIGRLYFLYSTILYTVISIFIGFDEVFRMLAPV